MVEPVWMFALGAACLLGAAVLYFKNTASNIFPIVLALAGVFLCAAESIKATLPGGVDIQFQRSVKEVANANVGAISSQQQALEAISKQLAAMTKQFADYQADVNQRFAALDATPIAVPTPPELERSSAELSRSLERAETQQVLAVEQNRELQNFRQFVRK